MCQKYALTYHASGVRLCLQGSPCLFPGLKEFLRVFPPFRRLPLTCQCLAYTHTQQVLESGGWGFLSEDPSEPRYAFDLVEATPWQRARGTALYKVQAGGSVRSCTPVWSNCRDYRRRTENPRYRRIRIEFSCCSVGNTSRNLLLHLVRLLRASALQPSE